MSKNIMSEVLKMLGVEHGEEFKLRYSDGKIDDKLYSFDKQGHLCRNSPFKAIDSYETLFLILQGDLEIVKIPWKPKHGDIYYTINIVGCKREPIVAKYAWDDYSIECLKDKALGMIYRTREEAESRLKNDYKKLRGLED